MSAVQPYLIVEALCASGKGSEALKEDRLVTTADFVAVIDGATPRLLFAHADWSGYSVFEEAFTRGHAAGVLAAALAAR